MVDRHVLASIVNPHVHDTWIVLSLSHSVRDVAAALCVLHPELANALVRIGKREITALGMCK